MAGARDGLTPGRRSVTAGLALLPFAACQKPAAIAKSERGTEALPVKAPDPGELVELIRLDPSIRLDIRYATADNFTGRRLYDEPRAFLTAAAASALVRAHARAKREGYGFLVYDAYRPLRVTRTMWDVTPRAKRNYVANPRKGSKHNRGCAIDLTLCDLASGRALEMPTGFDEFSARAHRDYRGASAEATANRDRLQAYMEAEEFRGMSNEWWHFDYRGWENYPVQDVPFDQIA